MFFSSFSALFFIRFIYGTGTEIYHCFPLDPALYETWVDLPKHPLQNQEPEGDRHWIGRSSSHFIYYFYFYYLKLSFIFADSKDSNKTACFYFCRKLSKCSRTSFCIAWIHQTWFWGKYFGFFLSKIWKFRKRNARTLVFYSTFLKRYGIQSQSTTIFFLVDKIISVWSKLRIQYTCTFVRYLTISAVNFIRYLCWFAVHKFFYPCHFFGPAQLWAISIFILTTFIQL